MAERIQSTVRLIHEFNEGKPTEENKPTDATTNAEEVGQNKKKVINGAYGIQKKLGRTAFKRRLVNYAFEGLDKTVDMIGQHRIFQATLYGDSKLARDREQNLGNVKAATNIARGLVGTSITSMALNNPAILYLHLANMGINSTMSLLDTEIKFNQYNQIRDREIFIANKRQERLIVNTYNRRG